MTLAFAFLTGLLHCLRVFVCENESSVKDQLKGHAYHIQAFKARGALSSRAGHDVLYFGLCNEIAESTNMLRCDSACFRGGGG